MKPKKKFLLLFLNMIKYQLTSRELINNGLTYSQIFDYLDYAYEQKYISESDGNNLGLTNKGERVLKELTNSLYGNDYYGPLIPLEEYRINKLDKYDVYLPKRKGK